MPKQSNRFEFVVEPTGAPIAGMAFAATLGDYDLDAPVGHGDTPSEAVIDWLEMHGETIDGEALS